LQCGNKAHFT